MNDTHYTATQITSVMSNVDLIIMRKREWAGLWCCRRARSVLRLLSAIAVAVLRSFAQRSSHSHNRTVAPAVALAVVVAAAHAVVDFALDALAKQRVRPKPFELFSSLFPQHLSTSRIPLWQWRIHKFRVRTAGIFFLSLLPVLLILP